MKTKSIAFRVGTMALVLALGFLVGGDSAAGGKNLAPTGTAKPTQPVPVDERGKNFGPAGTESGNSLASPFEPDRSWSLTGGKNPASLFSEGFPGAGSPVPGGQKRSAHLIVSSTDVPKAIPDDNPTGVTSVLLGPDGVVGTSTSSSVPCLILASRTFTSSSSPPRERSPR